ncbi:MAG: cell division protein SepF [Sporolactobacillus sp.]|jgi:cell division inhibitor SepF|nr:cell division protein SepF [Sporolactobacillus sp.]MCI1881696.1 cell division protein SepF [Sporolactobacillus sp.]
MGFKSAFRRFFDLEETIETTEDHVPAVDRDDKAKRASSGGKQTVGKGGRLVAFQNIRQKERVVLAEPRTIDEVEDIVVNLKNKRSVICSLQRAQKEDAQRILDFMAGTAFALDAQIRKVGKNTFLFAPDSVDISGMISGWRSDLPTDRR